MARSNIVAELMNEKIVYGGVIATRHEAYQHALEATGSHKAADMFAFGLRRKAATPEEVEQLEGCGLTMGTLRIMEMFSGARYAKRSVAFRPAAQDGFKTRLHRLADSLKARWSNRERAYILSRSKARKLRQLIAEGWDATTLSLELVPPKAA